MKTHQEETTEITEEFTREKHTRDTTARDARASKGINQRKRERERENR